MDLRRGRLGHQIGGLDIERLGQGANGVQPRRQPALEPLNRRQVDASTFPKPQAVVGLRVDPPRPVVGQPATIVVDMASQPLATIIRQVPVELIDDVGIHLLGTISNPGAGGTATLAWVPLQATDHGVFHAVDQSTDVIVLEAAAAPMGADASAAGAGVDDDSGTGPDE